jgi:putative sterol carrier protein
MAAGRGDFIDPPPETPGALLTMSSETYERLACGRVDPEQAVVTGAVTIEGDVDLGAAVVRELNQMF